VEKWIGLDEGQAGEKGRNRAGIMNQGNARGRKLLESERNEGERGRVASEDRGSEEDSRKRRATRDSPEEASPTTYQSKLT
jgi:hypothetical protein